jgi:hypothetical protein
MTSCTLMQLSVAAGFSLRLHRLESLCHREIYGGQSPPYESP